MKPGVQRITAVPAQAIVAVPPATTGSDLTDRDPAADSADRLARYRLIIEEGPSGSFVYKTLDRVTGEVVSQLPREEVLMLNKSPDYSSGQVIDTSA